MGCEQVVAGVLVVVCSLAAGAFFFWCFTLWREDRA